MSEDQNFQDTTGLLIFPVGLVVLLAMPLLPAVIGIFKVLTN